MRSDLKSTFAVIFKEKKKKSLLFIILPNRKFIYLTQF